MAFWRVRAPRPRWDKHSLGKLERGKTGDWISRPNVGLILLFVLVVPYMLWRATLASFFWIDEVFTVTMVHLDPLRLIEQTAFDAHPPGYYLALKFYLKAFRLLGAEPGLFLTRSPGLIAWAALAIGTYLAASRFIGRQYGAVAACAVCFNAQIVVFCTEMRQYSIIVPALTGCWLLLLAVYFETGRETVRRHRVLACWAAYVSLAGAALWMQLLTGPFLAVLGTIWLFLSARRKRWTGPFFRGGIVAHLTILLLIAPWLGNLRHNLEHLHFLPRPWQTPAQFPNLWSVFLFWFPLGQIDAGFPHIRWVTHPVMYVFNVLLWLGVLTLAVPGRIVVEAARRRPVRQPANATLTVAATGLGLAVGYTFLIWWFDRWGWARTFHGPRYPAVAVGAWVLGIVSLVAWAIERLGWKPGRAWLVMLPWFVCGFVGLWWTHAHMPRPSVEWAKSGIKWYFPEQRGTDVHVMPSEFIPYIEGFIPEYELHPIEEIASLPEDHRNVHVFNVSPLVRSYKPRDAVIYSLVKGARLSPDPGIAEIPLEQPLFAYYLLRDFNRDLAGKMNEMPVYEISRRISTPHAATAVPEIQYMFDGWAALDYGDKAKLYRWGEGARAGLRFDRRVEAGRYRLHLVGYRTEYPVNPATFRLQFRGEDEVRTVEQPSGGFVLSPEFTLAYTHDPPVLLIEHPTWQPSKYQAGALDPRHLSFLFEYAWLEPIR